MLGYEDGIGVRNGCFCAQPYVAELLGIGSRAHEAAAAASGPAWSALSFGAYNTNEDVDALVEALARICHGDYRGHYDRGSDGEYRPQKAFWIPVRSDERVESCASFT